MLDSKINDHLPLFELSQMRMANGKRGMRSNSAMTTNLGRRFTLMFTVAMLVFSTSASIVNSKSPSLFPKNYHFRRGSGTGSSSRHLNNKQILTTSTSTNKNQEAAWISGFKNSLASGLAAGCSKLILAPFDTIKTMQQAALVSGKAPLSLSKAVQEILQRPKGFLEFYVSSNPLLTCQNVHNFLRV